MRASKHDGFAALVEPCNSEAACQSAIDRRNCMSFRRQPMCTGRSVVGDRPCAVGSRLHPPVHDVLCDEA